MEVKPTYSFSKINTFDNCPRKYQFSYIKKYPRSPNAFSLKGTILHRMIEAYINNEDIDVPYEGDFCKIPLEEFNKHKAEFYKIKNQTLIKQLKIIFEKFEVSEMEMDLSNIFNMFKFNGSADTFVKNGTKCIIIDYKTGKVWKKFEQLEIYALIASYMYPELEEFKLILSFVSFNKDLEINISKKDISKIEFNLIKKINNMEVETTYNKKITKLCDFCEYKKECMEKDQLDKVMSDIIESSSMLPSSVSEPLVWDGYIGSEITIINDYPDEYDIQEKLIISTETEAGLMFWNIMEDYNIKSNNISIINREFYLNKGKRLELKFSSLNQTQFNDILTILDSKILIVLGEENFKSLTGLEEFNHNTKIRWEGKDLYMFEHPRDIFNDQNEEDFNDDITYNLLSEIKI